MIRNKDVKDSDILEVLKNTRSMLEAAHLLNMSYSSFKRRAIVLNVWKSNQGGKGMRGKRKRELDDIITNKVFASSGLVKQRVLEAGLKTKQCEECLNTEWLSKPITLELHHVDGNRYNNLLSNLQMLCPNCHSLTDTWRNQKR